MIRQTLLTSQVFLLRSDDGAATLTRRLQRGTAGLHHEVDAFSSRVCMRRQPLGTESFRRVVIGGKQEI